MDTLRSLRAGERRPAFLGVAGPVALSCAEVEGAVVAVITWTETDGVNKVSALSRAET